MATTKIFFVWHIELEKHFDDDKPNEWLGITAAYDVVATSYETATSAAEKLALADFFEDENGKRAHVDKTRLLSVKRGMAIDAIAK